MMTQKEMNEEKKQILIGCGTIIILALVFVGIGILIDKFLF